MIKKDQTSDEIVDEDNKAEVVEMPEPEDTSGGSNTNEPEQDEVAEENDQPKGPNIFQRLWAKYKAKKKITIPLTVVVVVGLLACIPVTRYALAGVVVKKSFSIKVIDSRTNIPISGVELNLRGKSAKTDGEGKATLGGVTVGNGQLKATKKYYKDFTAGVTTRFSTQKNTFEVKLEATGRQVPLHVTNKITGKNIANATVKAADTEVKTDKDGQATLVLPPSDLPQKGMVTAEGYNDLSVEVKVSELAVKENTFSLTPSGSLYFLSKKTGKIDVVKTDLDGNNRKTVLAATGKEEETNTILLASRDWKYLALLSRREGDKARLYLIETANDKLSEIDSGDASFTLVGWQDHYFVYQVSRDKVQYWQPKKYALKTYNADTKQLATLDETNAEGAGEYDYISELINNVYILKDSVLYTKQWSGSYYSAYRLANKRMGIYRIKSNASSKQTIKDFDSSSGGYFSAVLYEPEEVYFALYSNNNTTYYEFEDGKVAEVKDVNQESFSKFYPTFLVSPNGNNTFWYEPRDGKNTLFVGPASGENGKEITSLSEYVPYGWYGEDYLLVSKDSSELYILSTSGPTDKVGVLKVTDYHKPTVSFQGYGYGYGGF